MELVSRVSHELKTPIALIKMYAETIGRSVDARRADPAASTRESETARFAGIIDREADRLTGMVQRILDFARIDSQSAHPEELDLRVLLRDLIDEYAPPRRGTRRRNRDRRPRRELSRVGRGGPQRLRQRVPQPARERGQVHAGCAAPPAVAGGDGGTPSPDHPPVEVSLRVDGERAVWTVADRGIGIPEGELEHVFESFYRASNAQEAPGVGIGLGIVRAFFEAHDGDIRARHREDGPGTIMTCSLPIHRLPR